MQRGYCTYAYYTGHDGNKPRGRCGGKGSCGQCRVRVTEGKFKGVTGIVARIHGQQRVAVVIEGVLAVATAYVPSAFLQRLDAE